MPHPNTAENTGGRDPAARAAARQSPQHATDGEPLLDHRAQRAGSGGHNSASHRVRQDAAGIGGAATQRGPPRARRSRCARCAAGEAARIVRPMRVVHTASLDTNVLGCLPGHRTVPSREVLLFIMYKPFFIDVQAVKDGRPAHCINHLAQIRGSRFLRSDIRPIGSRRYARRETPNAATWVNATSAV